MPVLRRPDVIPLLVASPMQAIFAWWALDDGGYFPAAWLPGTALALCLLLVAVVGGAARRPGRAATVALAALAGYTAWSFASILWADAPGTALEGSQRTLLYLCCFGLFALLPWTPTAALWMLGAFAGIVTVAGIVTLLRAAGIDQPAELFVEHRLSSPLGYQNANAALWTMAALPALALASSRGVSIVLRALLLGSCPLLLGLAILAQSRGWLFTLPIVLLVALAIVPARARLLLFALPVAGALALITGDLLEPYRVGGQLPPAQTAPIVRPAIDTAVRMLLLAAGALVLVGATLAWIERLVLARWQLPTGARRLGRPLAILTTVAVVAGAAAAAVVVGNGDPVDRLERAWTEFKGNELASSESSRFSSVGGERYDFWRVAVDEWSAHPLAGLGQDNYAEAYVRERTTLVETRWVHSLALRLLVHTGLVGAVLFLAFAVAALVASARGWLRRGPPGTYRLAGTARLAGALTLLPAVVWLTHGSVDWLWEYPVLSGPALAFAGIAVALGDRAQSADEPQLAPVVPRRAALAAGGFVTLGLALLLPTYVAVRDVRQAAKRWPAGPAAAFARLDRAAALNPLDVRAPLVEGLIAARGGDPGRARRALAQAAEREPHNWFVRFSQALVASARGDRRAAERHLRAARRLNPKEGLVEDALRRVQRARPMRLDEALRRLGLRVERLRA